MDSTNNRKDTKKIIYLSPVEYSNRIARDYLINDLIAKGQEVEYWNIGNLIFGNNPDSVKNYKYTNFNQLESALELLDNKNIIFVILVCYELRSLKLYKLLTRHNLFIIYIQWGSTKVFSRLKYVANYFKKNNVRVLIKVIEKFYLYLNRIFKLVKPFDVLFLAENFLLDNSKYAKKIKFINSCDYENFISPKKFFFKDKYAVFLDVNLPFHFDNKIFNFKKIEPENYFESLNNFFTQIESKFKIKVIIAAHPTTDKRYRHYYRRQVFYDKTSELVSHSEFVISHHSLSINFAVLNYKPILFIFTDDMFKLYEYTTVQYINNLANFFQMPFINIDHIVNWQIALYKVKKSIYNNYKYNYLTAKKTEFKSNGELFSDFLIDYNFNS